MAKGEDRTTAPSSRARRWRLALVTYSLFLLFSLVVVLRATNPEGGAGGGIFAPLLTAIGLLASGPAPAPGGTSSSPDDAARGGGGTSGRDEAPAEGQPNPFEQPGAGALAVENAPARVVAGRVIDLLTGAAVAGARIRATAFHRPSFPDTAGCPALHEELVAAAEDGSIWLEAIAPQDPRLAVHVQVDHPGYAPAVAVLEGRDSCDGRWQAIEIGLRRALTAPVRVADATGRALAGAPLRVVAREDGYSFLDAKAGEPVEIAVSPRREEIIRISHGRLVTPAPAQVLYTDERGIVRLPFSDYRYDLELLDPQRYLVYREAVTEPEQVGRAALLLPPEGTVDLLALDGWLERHIVLDADGIPVPEAEIELALEGMPVLRLLTDAEGWFTAGVMPFPPGEKPLGYQNPRPGTLTVLTPALHLRGASIALPSHDEAVMVNGRPAGRLLFRAVGGSPERPLPASPQGVVISRDLTLVRLDADGGVEFHGALPQAGEAIDVAVRGYLPARVVLSESGTVRGEIQLGNVQFSRGWAREFILTGAEESHVLRFQGARLLVSCAGEAPAPLTEEQVYRVPPAGRVTVAGLRRGVYHIGVEGPGIRTYSDTVEMLESQLEEPVVIPLEESGEEEVVVAGRIVELAPYVAVRSQVVERYTIAGVSEPMSMPPYPLAADCRFGSVRRLRGVLGVHVAVIGPGEEAADVFLPRGDGPPVFHAGDLRLLPRPRAAVSFYVEGLGRVAPPLHVALQGPGGIEAIARFRLRDRTLFVEDLRRGAYSLRWQSAQGVEEALAFEVSAEQGATTRVTAWRAPLPEEVVEIRVLDSQGLPIGGAEVDPPAPFAPGGFQAAEPGTQLAVVMPRRTTRFAVRAPGYLAANVEVEPGGVVPTEISLFRGAGVRGTLLDTDSSEVDGDVLISWEPLTPATVTHGVPLRVSVEHGRLRALGLPPLPLLFTFQLENSGAALKRELALPEGDDRFDVGTLHLGETRALRGKAFLPDGRPAAGAAMALLRREEAYRFPLVEPRDLSRSRHRATANTQGTFTIDGLPQDLPADLVLVARLDGYGDAVEDPVDLDAEAHELALTLPSALELDVGYRDGIVRDLYRFSLEYWRDPADLEARLDLGEIVPQLYGLYAYSAIEPGLYRVKWGLRDAYEPIPGLWEDMEVLPGSMARLSLLIRGQVLTGSARLNGARVERGWILMTADPGVNGGTRVGRILDGEFLLVDPPDAFRAYAAVIPEAEPQSLQNIARGEALPVSIPTYHSARREGALHFQYKAHNLTLQFAADFLARHPGAVLDYESYEWDRSRFRATPAEERIESPTVHFRLLSPGLHHITVRSDRGTLILTRVVDLREDTVVHIH